MRSYGPGVGSKLLFVIWTISFILVLASRLRYRCYQLPWPVAFFCCCSHHLQLQSKVSEWLLNVMLFQSKNEDRLAFHFKTKFNVSRLKVWLRYCWFNTRNHKEALTVEIFYLNSSKKLSLEGLGERIDRRGAWLLIIITGLIASIDIKEAGRAWIRICCFHFKIITTCKVFDVAFIQERVFLGNHQQARSHVDIFYFKQIANRNFFDQLFSYSPSDQIVGMVAIRPLRTSIPKAFKSISVLCIVFSNVGAMSFLQIALNESFSPVQIIGSEGIEGREGIEVVDVSICLQLQ